MKNESFDAAASAIAAKTTYVGTATAGVGWLGSNEFALLVGVIVGIAGFFVNWYYKAKEDRRREREVNAMVARETFYDQG